MFRLAMSLLYDEDESKDIVSEVFASLLGGDMTINSDNARGFLLTCVRNSCINVIRHKQKSSVATAVASHLHFALSARHDVPAGRRCCGREPRDGPSSLVAVIGENQRLLFKQQIIIMNYVFHKLN